MHKKINLVRNMLIVFIVLIIVLYFSLKDNFDEIISYISNMNVLYLILAILILVIYRTLIGISSYYVTISNKQKYSLLRSIQVNFIILFFHGVTPFSGGGQPMEIYYLKKEKIPVSIATNIVLQNFMIYQTALIITGIFAIIYNHFFNIFPSSSLIRKLVMLGFLVNFLVWIGSFIISFGKKINKFISTKVLKLLGKLKIIKNVKEARNKLDDYLDSFHNNAIALKNKKMMLVKAVFINIFAIFILYSIPYIITLGLGVNTDYSIITFIVTTTYVMIIGSFVPIPGGTGGIEYGFIYFYGYLMSGGVLTAIMLIWRFISYYLGVIIGAVCLGLYRKKEE